MRGRKRGKGDIHGDDNDEGGDDAEEGGGEGIRKKKKFIPGKVSRKFKSKGRR